MPVLSAWGRGGAGQRPEGVGSVVWWAAVNSLAHTHCHKAHLDLAPQRIDQRLLVALCGVALDVFALVRHGHEQELGVRKVQQAGVVARDPRIVGKLLLLLDGVVCLGVQPGVGRGRRAARPLGALGVLRG